jgi:hypothetical protein
MKIIIPSIRYGFATNSSSTHSILFKCPDSEEYPERFSFGWDDFLLQKETSKLEYLSMILYENLPDELSEEIKIDLIKTIIGINISSEGYIDHQSILTIPKTFEEKFFHKEFFQDLLKFISNPNISIAGGNDNGGDSNYVGEKILLSNYPKDLDINHRLVCRKDTDYYTLFNRKNGKKIRISFDDELEKVKCKFIPTRPELVDLKITNYCENNCLFCYQSSIKDAKHASENATWYLIDKLAESEIFELAIGGGEPTKHPYFSRILEHVKYKKISVSFSTYDMSWIKNYSIKKTVEQTTSAFGVSCVTTKTVDEICTWNKEHRDGAYGVLHIPLGCYSREILEPVIKKAFDLYIPVVFLGFKKFGRGLNFTPYDYNWIISYFKNNTFGADSTLVEEFKNDLDEYKIPKYLRVVGEGIYSCAIDMVDKTISESSYSNIKYKLDLENIWKDFPFNKNSKKLENNNGKES